MNTKAKQNNRAMEFSIRAAKIEAQRDALLSAAEFTLSVMVKNRLDVELSERMAIEKLRAAIQQAKGGAE